MRLSLRLALSLSLSSSKISHVVERRSSRAVPLSPSRSQRQYCTAPCVPLPLPPSSSLLLLQPVFMINRDRALKRRGCWSREGEVAKNYDCTRVRVQGRAAQEKSMTAVRSFACMFLPLFLERASSLTCTFRCLRSFPRFLASPHPFLLSPGAAAAPLSVSLVSPPSLIPSLVLVREARAAERTHTGCLSSPSVRVRQASSTCEQEQE